jgi:hypothetical protein
MIGLRDLGRWFRGLLQYSTFPVAFVFCIELIGFATLLLLQIFRQSNINFTNKFGLGYDFQHFYLSSQVLLSGISPYTIGHYVTPPLPSILFVPFVWLFDFHSASLILFVLIPACVVASIALIHQSANRDLAPSEKIKALFLIISIMAFGYPFLFLMDRQNIDGFVLLALSATIFLLPKKQWAAGLLLAIAISLKLYPILLLLPLLLRRKWIAILFCGIGLAAFFLATPALWTEFLSSRLFFRSAEFRADENASLASMFYAVGNAFAIPPGAFTSNLAGMLATGVFFCLLAGMAILDFRFPRTLPLDSELAWVTMYIPFMIAIPQLVYPYEDILLIAFLPILCHFWLRTKDAWGRGLLLMMASGIALTQLQIIVMNRLLGAGRCDPLPGFGVFLLLLGCVGYKYHSLRLAVPHGRGDPTGIPPTGSA